jgi:hypothetical protein
MAIKELYLMQRGMNNSNMKIVHLPPTMRPPSPPAENAVLDTENNRSPSVVQSMEEVRRLDVASTNTPNMVVK